MDVYSTEEEQIEHIKKWWKENGLSIVGGVVIGLSAIFGWRAWQGYQIEQSMLASDIFQSMIVNVRQAKHPEVRESAEKLLKEYKGTTYAVYAAFVLANMEVENNEYAEAIRHLQWVEKESDSAEYITLAKLRRARIMLLDGKSDEALELLESTSPGKYLSSFEELKGDVYLQLGKTEAARDAYEIALASRDTSINNTYLELKINNLGGP